MKPIYTIIFFISFASLIIFCACGVSRKTTPDPKNTSDILTLYLKFQEKNNKNIDLIIVSIRQDKQNNIVKNTSMDACAYLLSGDNMEKVNEVLLKTYEKILKKDSSLLQFKTIKNLYDYNFSKLSNFRKQIKVSKSDIENIFLGNSVKLTYLENKNYDHTSLCSKYEGRITLLDPDVIGTMTAIGGAMVAARTAAFSTDGTWLSMNTVLTAGSGEAIGAAGVLTTSGSILVAGVSGYKVGQFINDVINYATGDYTLGDLAYDLTHPREAGNRVFPPTNTICDKLPSAQFFYCGNYDCGIPDSCVSGIKVGYTLLKLREGTNTLYAFNTLTQTCQYINGWNFKPPCPGASWIPYSAGKLEDNPDIIYKIENKPK